MRELLCKGVEFSLMRKGRRFVVTGVYRFVPFEREECLHALAKLRRAPAGEIGAADALVKEGVAGEQGIAAQETAPALRVSGRSNDGKSHTAQIENFAISESKIEAEGLDGYTHRGGEIGGRADEFFLLGKAADLCSRRLQRRTAADMVEMPVGKENILNFYALLLGKSERFFAAAVDEHGALAVFGNDIGIGPQNTRGDREDSHKKNFLRANLAKEMLRFA